jgi:hypothetical protein
MRSYGLGGVLTGICGYWLAAGPALSRRNPSAGCLAEIGDGAGVVAEPFADQAARGEGAGRMGVEFDGAIGVSLRLDILAGEIMRPGAIVKGERGGRGELDGARVVGERAGKVEPLALGVAAIDVGVG